MSLTSKGRHSAPTKTRKGWRRILPTTIVGKIVVGTASIALAAWAVLNAATLSVSSASMAVSYNTASAPQIIGGVGCSASFSGQTLNVTWSGGTPGDPCQVRVFFTAPAGNTVDGRLQAFNVAGDPGVLASLGVDCGVTISPNGNAGATVSFDLDPNQTTLGGSYSIGAGSGFSWVPAPMYSAGSCT